MIDLELNDPQDTLWDVVSRMPEERRISIGILGGFLYEGSVGGFRRKKEELDEYLLDANAVTFRRGLVDYREAHQRKDRKERDRVQKKLESCLAYAVDYKRLGERHIIRAYTRGINDSIIALILEGKERMNSDPLTE